MSITLKQLQALSEEFDFDYNEARKFLGHSEPKKRGRPPKKVDSESEDEVCVTLKCVKDDKKPRSPRNDNKTKKQETPRSEAKKQETPKSEAKKQDTPRSETKKTGASKSGGRPPSGYNLFVKDQGKSITESAKEWKALSDAKRASWNSKAAKEKSIFDIFG